MARQVRPGPRQPGKSPALRARTTDKDEASAIHQGQGLGAPIKVRIYGRNLYLLTVID